MRRRVGALRVGAWLGASALRAAAGARPARTAATQDEAEIEAKTRNPPAAALEPHESSFAIPNPIFIPPQTLVRRWRINTVERDVVGRHGGRGGCASAAWSRSRSC